MERLNWINMAKLKLIRPPEGVHDERKFRIYINGVIRIIMKQKSSAEIEVPDVPYELQVISSLGRSRKVTIDPTTTAEADLRMNKKMHRNNPSMFAPTIVIFAGIAFSSFPSIFVKIGAALAFIAAAVWTLYALRIKREEWIHIVPKP